MSRKKKTPPSHPRKRKPIEIESEGDGSFAQFFEEITKSMFEKADYFPEPAKVIDLQQWRKDKKDQD